MKFNNTKKIEKNVLSFLKETSEEVGRLSADGFCNRIECDLDERGMQSPIEDIFYIALAYKCHELEYQFNPSPDYDYQVKKIVYPDGIYVDPQYKVGKYRVDFLVSYQRDEKLEKLIIELDGHDFHDKNKKQRAYEKARDRYLVQQGYKVFHYTGSEIFSSSFDIANEVIQEITKPFVVISSIGGFE